jgi:glutamate 5-kinase
MGSPQGRGSSGEQNGRVREAVTSARRVVVKVGSSSLTTATGGIDEQRVDALVDVLGTLAVAGREVVLVSSGAIAAGLAPLQLPRRPRDLATQQAAASVGQGLLIGRYAGGFARHGLTVGQVLLTVDDVTRRAHYRNAYRTLRKLLDLRAVPIVNENDTVATEEIRFGDNDRLAALVAALVDADLLVLLSDVDALYTGKPSDPASRRIADVRDESDLANVSIGRPGSKIGTGGMITKVEAARIATGFGIPVVLTAAPLAGSALDGDEIGTFFHPIANRPAARLFWLAHATTPRGRLHLDPGAVAAVVARRMSLLPAGITAVDGSFAAGDPVDLVDAGSGASVARGLVNYDAVELPALLGRSTPELAAALGPGYEREVVHRDDLVLL